MTLERNNEFLLSLLKELVNLPKETEWVEFKENKAEPEDIGQYISALSNSAALKGKSHGYLVWGITDLTHEIVGTTFNPFKTKIGNEELTNWLLQRLSPKIYFCFYELFFGAEKKKIIFLEINSAINTTVQFTGLEYIRIGTYRKSLKEFPEVAKILWRTLDKKQFELQPAAENVSEEEVLQLLDYPSFFDLLNLPLPDSRAGILNRLEEERMLISHKEHGKWTVTNTGALLFAKKLKSFRHLERKAVRVILYKQNSRIDSIKEIESTKGYASGFVGLMESVNSLLPANEVIGAALRKNITMFPEVAVRELIANAIIHQDLTETGTSPMVEIFGNRLEITNPGVPMVDVIRLLDLPPKSRNELIAAFMRRIGFCEERGSGIDKVVLQTEMHQLPAPEFAVVGNHTRATLFAHKDFNEMNTEERVMACYLHCCLKYVSREPMNNASLRIRFDLDEKNSASSSRVIAQTIKAGYIKLYDATANRRSLRYIPFWG